VKLGGLKKWGVWGRAPDFSAEVYRLLSGGTRHLFVEGLSLDCEQLAATLPVLHTEHIVRFVFCLVMPRFYSPPLEGCPSGRGGCIVVTYAPLLCICPLPTNGSSRGKCTIFGTPIAVLLPAATA
jgi:hypothetical protein